MRVATVDIEADKTGFSIFDSKTRTPSMMIDLYGDINERYQNVLNLINSCKVDIVCINENKLGRAFDVENAYEMCDNVSFVYARESVK